MSIRAVVFASYFVLVFALGWLSLRRTESETDYWIAGGKLGWLVGGSTLAATHTSAGTFIGTIGVIYTVGWSFSWLVLTVPLAYWFIAAVLAPRFTKDQKLTLPEFLEARYESQGVRGVSAVVILIATVVYVQAQIVAGGLIANTVFGIPVEIGMIAFTVILLAYTVVGGMVAVVYTDFIQLVIMTVGVIFAAPLAIQAVGSTGALVDALSVVRPRFFSWDGLPTTLLITMGLAFFLGSVSTPEKLIRLYAMRDMRTIRRGILLAILAITGINLLVFILALVAVALFPALPTGDLAMPMVASAVLPPVLGTIMLAAIASAMMSTVDSLLIVAGSALSYDLYQNLINPEASLGARNWLNRLGILVVGVAPVILLLFGIGEGELVQIIVLLFTALMASSFFAPVVLGVYWRRATKHGAVASILGGVFTTFLWEVMGNETIQPVLPGFVVSVLLMVGVSLVTTPPSDAAIDPYFDTRPST